MRLQESSTGNSTNIQSPNFEPQSKPIQTFQPQSIEEIESISPREKITKLPKKLKAPVFPAGNEFPGS